jgi:hypothetical protein
MCLEHLQRYSSGNAISVTADSDIALKEQSNFESSTNSREPGSSVGIATGYGLDCPGIESRWRRDFPHLSRPALGPTQPPVQWVLGLSRGRKLSGRDNDPSPPSNAEV